MQSDTNLKRQLSFIMPLACLKGGAGKAKPPKIKVVPLKIIQRETH